MFKGENIGMLQTDLLFSINIHTFLYIDLYNWKITEVHERLEVAVIFYKYLTFKEIIDPTLCF